MLRDGLMGAAAGAVGTVALNIATYADMVIRARAASQVPARLAGVVADKLGFDLEGEGNDAPEQAAQHRRTALGALFGYTTGLGVGSLYGIIRPHIRNIPAPLPGVAVGLAAMAASDLPATIAGVTTPAKWSRTSWMLDVGFHLAYGLTTAIAYDAFVDA